MQLSHAGVMMMNDKLLFVRQLTVGMNAFYAEVVQKTSGKEERLLPIAVKGF